MAEPVIFSSQGSHYDQHQILIEQENLDSSPQRDSGQDVPALHSQKPKKPPTVTPQRFTKFFTPRSSLLSRGARRSRAGRQLRDITRNGTNRRSNAWPRPDPDLLASNENASSERPSKRRKHSIDIGSSPPQSSPLKHVQAVDEIMIFEDAPTSPTVSDDESLSEVFDQMESFSQPIKRLRQVNSSRRILQRSFGGYDAVTRGWRGGNHCADWRAETANFVTDPADVHSFTGTALPFCTASCNTNSLIAVGEEEGSVRLIDSSRASDFTTAYVTFRPHHNAIMDVAFSSDDYTLATASGDQTTRIIDMHSQETVCVLSGHKSSVKQVRFQPNDDNMITTSSRDGSAQIWDMRCGGKGSVASLRTAFARNVDNGEKEPTVRYSKYTLDVGSAHRSMNGTNQLPLSSNPGSDGVSVTAIQHLPNGREHLLLTTSEINSSIKLWDLRNAGRRGGLTTPLSSTPTPQSHSKTRNYGIIAMALSTDGGRLYTACKDGTVYAYSTNHLVLGCVSEMSSSSGKGRMFKAPKAGAGPLYGFRLPALRINSFYIKASLRPASGDRSEMLAVGSSDNCTVLFPTDERYFTPRGGRYEGNESEEESGEVDLPTSSALLKTQSVPTSIPTHQRGTALIRGHNKEVTASTWTHEGELVTISDDFTARCWREDAAKARELRGCGEAGGTRWRSGWADLDTAWDEEEG